ncbi:MAG: ATP-binding protein [Planctomycetota bacterium]
MDRDQLFAVLDGFNPWWKGERRPVPSFHRLAYHTCRRFLGMRELRRAVLLSGARRVGKTTVLLQIVDALLNEGHEPQSICHLSLDHPLIKLVTLPELLGLYHERVYPDGKPVWLLLDEVQYSPEWDLYLKQLVDQKPQYRILATGSSSLAHRQRLSHSGVGRWIRVPMPTLSFYEFAALRGEARAEVPAELRPSDLFSESEMGLATLASRLRPLMPLFQRYLLVGGFPETARLDRLEVCQQVLREDVVERVLKRDMVGLFGVRSVANLERLFMYICVHSGGLLSVRQCSQNLGIAAATVGSHLESLEQGHLIYRLPPAAVGGKKTLNAPQKVYLADAALRNAVLLKGEEVLRDPDEMGRIVETMMVRHLATFRYWDVPRVTYWRDSPSGDEVDVVVRTPRYAIPVEVKYRSRAPLTAKEGIVHFCREEAVPEAYWVTQREEDFGVARFDGLDTRFLRIPAHILAYLLGQTEQPPGDTG